MPPLSAIIFDLDGLVLDTESTYLRAWQQAARAIGYELANAFWQSLSGLHQQDVDVQLAKIFGSDVDLARFHQQAGAYWRQSVYTSGIPVQPGVLELLAYLKQHAIPYALATNSRAANVRECLDLAGLSEAFQLQATRDDVEVGKPAPDVFYHAANLLHTPITDCWVLEDSLTGILAAKQSGAYSVFIPSIFPVNAEAAQLCDLQLPSLVALLAILPADFP